MSEVGGLGEPQRMGDRRPNTFVQETVEHTKEPTFLQRVKDKLTGHPKIVGGTAAAIALGGAVMHDVTVPPIEHAAAAVGDATGAVVSGIENLNPFSSVDEQPWPKTFFETANGGKTSYVWEITLSPDEVDQSKPIIFRNSLDTTTDDNILNAETLQSMGLISIDGKPIEAHGELVEGPSFPSNLQKGRNENGRGQWIKITDSMGEPLKLNGKPTKIYTSGNFATVKEGSGILPVILP